MVLKKLSSHLLVASCLILAVAAVQADEDEAAGIAGTARADSQDHCVRETPYMRRNHFELILHQRDVTVHQGIRGVEESIANCVDCHTRKDEEGKFVPVNQDGEFCAECHERAAVSIDCFSCHRTIPDGEKSE